VASDSHAALQAAANSLPNASRQNATNHIQNRCPKGRFLFRTDSKNKKLTEKYGYSENTDH